MFGNNKRPNYNSSNDNIFNVSGQNIMTNGKNVDAIINENIKLKAEISKKNREIEDAKKRLQIIEREIAQLRKQKNNNSNNQIKNRGRSVGMKNNFNNINYNDNNFSNNNYNNNFIGFSGGMINENDPFNDSFFQFQ